MTTIAYFLIGCIFCIYKFSPKTNSSIWKYSIVIPIIFTILSFFGSFGEILGGTSGVYRHSLSYGVGKWTSTIILPFIISIPFLYYFFKKKILDKGNKTGYPIILIGFAAFVMLLIGKYQKDLEVKNHKNFEKIIARENAIDEIKSSILTLKKRLPIITPSGDIIYSIYFNEKDKQVESYYKNPTAIEEMDPTEIEDYRISWKEDLIRVSRNNPKNISFVTASISMVYKLEDTNGKPIFNITISPNDMK